MFPIIFQSDIFTLYSYPLFLGLSWGIGYNLLKTIIGSEKKSQIRFNVMFFMIFLFAWIGAKIFYILFSKLPVSSTTSFEYLSSTNFWFGGGFVFYGGLLGGLTFFLFYSLILKKFDFKKSYLLIFPLLVGHAIGRIGCLLAGCCYGTVTESFFGIDMHGISRHPVQLYEVISLMILAVIVKKQERMNQASSKIVGTYFFGYLIIRFVLEFFRGDKIRGIYGELSTSQIISIVGIVFLVLIFLKKKYLRGVYVQ